MFASFISDVSMYIHLKFYILDAHTNQFGNMFMLKHNHKRRSTFNIYFDRG